MSVTSYGFNKNNLHIGLLVQDLYQCERLQFWNKPTREIVFVGIHIPILGSWSLAKVVVSCVLPTQGHVTSDGPTAAMKTDALLLQVRGCGTIFQLLWDKLTLTLNSSSGCWRHFCSNAENVAHLG